MNYDDTDPIDDAQPSATERQLRRLVVPEPEAYAKQKSPKIFCSIHFHPSVS